MLIGMISKLIVVLSKMSVIILSGISKSVI